MAIVRELPIVDEKLVLERDILAKVGLTRGWVTCMADEVQIVIRPAGVETDREELIRGIMANSGCSREEVERFLAAAGAWADDDETVERIGRLRQEMNGWQSLEW